MSALGGGPVLVRSGKAIFRSGEDFTSDQISDRDARAAVGQLADGRVILVTVDGGQPGSSVGMTSFELAQTLIRLGAVTACAVESGGAVTAAFDGRLLDRPSNPGGEQPIGEALLVEYFGVYAPTASVPLVNGDPGADAEPLEYKLVRPSTVTAELVGPNGVVHVLESSVAHPPGTYSNAANDFDAEGEWHWNVTATDDLHRVSTIDRTFRVDSTLRGLVAPRARARAGERPVRARTGGDRGVTHRDDRRCHGACASGDPVAVGDAAADVGRDARRRPACAGRNLRRARVRHE